VPALGTDYLGRDVLAGVIHGGSTTLRVALVAALLIVLIGVTIGSVAGFYGGWVDSLLMRVTEVFQVMPALLFALVIVTLFGPSPTKVSIAIGVVLWPQLARLTRAEFLRLKNLEFVKAARAIGSSDARIMFRVILPNALPPLIVATTLVMGSAILFEAALAFLGLGDPKNISWGLMIGLSRPSFLSSWWAITFPGIAIFLTVLSFSLIGDGLQDAFNPKLRGR
jgi:peptide/nickel transport system permease protein